MFTWRKRGEGNYNKRERTLGHKEDTSKQARNKKGKEKEHKRNWTTVRKGKNQAKKEQIIGGFWR